LAENVYECLFLLDPNHYARDPAGTGKLVDQLIEDAGGKVLVSRLWNEQRLAYPIEGHRKGTYWLAYFEMSGDGVSQLNRACQIHDTVLRQLVLKVDPRLVETLVAHAKGEAVPELEAGAGEGESEVAAQMEESTQSEPVAEETEATASPEVTGT